MPTFVPLALALLLAVDRRPELEHIGIPWVDLAAQPERREDVARVPSAPVGGADLVRSPDGARIARIAPARTARRNARLLVSDDEGASWSYLHELPASLNGVGHASSLTPDGRLVIAFRDVARESPTRGDFVVWVGAFDDLISGDEGDYRVRVLDDQGRMTRTGPVAIEVEPDGTIVATTRWIAEPETRPTAVAVRFTLDDVETLIPTRGYTIPLIDLAAETHRQVVVDREPGQYLGHPTTVLLEDNRTMITVYPKGHGRGAIVMKRSDDAGRTWSERLPVPESWATSQEVPTLHRVIDPVDGRQRIIVFSGLYPIRMAVTEDDGATWSELEPIGDYGGIVTMGCVDRLANGDYMALFHDDGRFLRAGGSRASEMWVYKVLSTDGGLTWSAPEMIATRPDVHLCEPGLIRSPDGGEIAVLLRENRRRRNSFVIFSRDEGQTWTKPRELPAALTGDRHTGRYAPDGRLFISFRDTTHESPTKGDWVGWVGTYEDIRRGRQGQYRVRLMNNHVRGDCAYPGVEILPDGTYVCTTYGHWTEGEAPYIVSVRFTLEELDERAGNR